MDVDAVAFDKDGTLIDLDGYWLEPSRIWVEEAAAGDPDVARLLAAELGLEADRLRPGGPLAMGTVEQVTALTAELLRGLGVPGADADRRASEARRRAMEAGSNIPLRALGDVAGTLRRLREEDVGVAVVTADDHAPTRRALDDLGLADLVDLVLTADGDIPPKPHPAVVTTVASFFATSPDRILVVGDSPVDAETARAAGAAGFVLVGQPVPGLDADAVVASVDELTVG